MFTGNNCDVKITHFILHVAIVIQVNVAYLNSHHYKRKTLEFKICFLTTGKIKK